MIKILFTKTPPIYFFLAALFMIKLLGVFFATKIFASYSPLVDSTLYLSNFYTNEFIFRTIIVQALANFLSGIAGPFFAHLIFGLFSVIGFFYYYARGGRSWLILLFLLLPSSFVWTSIVGKEALFFGGMGLCLFIWSKILVERLDWLDWAGLIFGISLCLFMRPHYGIALLWLFVSTSLLKHFGGSAAVLLFISYICFGLVIYYFAWDQLLDRGFGGIDSAGRASRFDSFDIEPNSIQGLEKFKDLVPLGIIFGVVGPLPSELINRIEFFPFFVEGVLVLMFPFIIVLIMHKLDFCFNPLFFRIFWWCLLPGIFFLMVIHAPFGILNPGSAIRWRTNFEQFLYLAPTLLIYRCMNEKN
jgi:hypothetical protein